MKTVYGYGAPERALCKIEIERGQDQECFRFKLSSREDSTSPWELLPVGICPGEDQSDASLYVSLPLSSLEGTVSMAQIVAESLFEGESLVFRHADHLRVIKKDQGLE